MNFRIIHYNTLDSTNSLALEFAREGAAEGTVVTAEYQTEGRGRLKRKWISLRGTGLLFSLILRPKFKVSLAPYLTRLAGEAVQETLAEKFKLSGKLKLPNDVLIGKKKISGILTESTGSGKQIDHVVIGIGLNVMSKLKDLPRKATSILLETGKKADKQKLLLDILNRIDSKYKSYSKSLKPKKSLVLTQ